MPQSTEEKQFWKNIQNLINDYVIDRHEWKDTERIRHGTQLVMNEFWIWRTIDEKQNEFLDKQMELLEKMRKCIETKQTGEKLKKLVRQYMGGFKSFIL